jgi:hypothetical protein
MSPTRVFNTKFIVIQAKQKWQILTISKSLEMCNVHYYLINTFVILCRQEYNIFHIICTLVVYISNYIHIYFQIFFETLIYSFQCILKSELHVAHPHKPLTWVGPPCNWEFSTTYTSMRRRDLYVVCSSSSARLGSLWHDWMSQAEPRQMPLE